MALNLFNFVGKVADTLVEGINEVVDLDLEDATEVDAIVTHLHSDQEWVQVRYIAIGEERELVEIFN